MPPSREIPFAGHPNVGAALFAWLKGVAPTSPTRAGWVVGIAAGAAGATIVALATTLAPTADAISRARAT